MSSPGASKLDNYAFPSDILDDATLDRALAADRIQALRERLLGGAGDMITYVAPWFAGDQIQAAGVDWIFSQAVLEHVDELDGAYQAFSAWLKPEGVMSHQIDFKCHNMANTWNGHWACSDWLWRVVRGRRPYLLNREPVTTHQDLLAHHGFEVLALTEQCVMTAMGRQCCQCGFDLFPTKTSPRRGIFNRA